MCFGVYYYYYYEALSKFKTKSVRNFVKAQFNFFLQT